MLLGKLMKLSSNFLGYLNISVVTYYELLNGLLYKDAQKQMANFLKTC